MNLRRDLAQIAAWIPAGTRVLDLGCGDGALLEYLRVRQGCDGYGVEIADASVLACVKRGVNVLQADLESGLRLFTADRFDVVVLSQTLQSMRHVEAILLEMVRVGRQGIVSFPNFGHWQHLMSLLGGRMPVTPDIPYQWYDTPNIHLCTPRDFELLAARLGLRITDRALLAGQRPVSLLAPLRAKVAVYRFEKQ
jgi:methionine biosynthesis protein MetW